jgi:hypothetical protein
VKEILYREHTFDELHAKVVSAKAQIPVQFQLEVDILLEVLLPDTVQQVFMLEERVQLNPLFAMCFGVSLDKYLAHARFLNLQGNYDLRGSLL